MKVVWATFLVVGAVLAALAIVVLRRRDGRAPAFRAVGRGLLILAGVTALFPVLLPLFLPLAWAALYVAFVLVYTAVLTTVAVRRARRNGA